MEIRVLLFGPVAEAAGRSEVVVRLGSDRTCAGVLEALRGVEGVSRLVGSCRLAVNHAYAAADQEVRVGDEVALVGLVSGG